MKKPRIAIPRTPESRFAYSIHYFLQTAPDLEQVLRVRRVPPPQHPGWGGCSPLTPIG